MRSPSFSPLSCAVRTLIQAEGSHVIFVIGFGSSCSHPLFAKRPSQMVGSGRKMISRPPLAFASLVLAGAGARGARSEVRAVLGAAAPAAFAPGVATAPDCGPRASELGPRLAVPVTNPSCSACFQNASGVVNACPLASVIVQPPTLPAWARVQ